MVFIHLLGFPGTCCHAGKFDATRLHYYRFCFLNNSDVLLEHLCIFYCSIYTSDLWKRLSVSGLGRNFRNLYIFILHALDTALYSLLHFYNSGNIAWGNYLNISRLFLLCFNCNNCWNGTTLYLVGFNQRHHSGVQDSKRINIATAYWTWTSVLSNSSW